MRHPNRTGRAPSLVLVAAVIAVLASTASARGNGGPHVAFATSVTGTGEFGTWPERDPGTQGLAAADSICRNMAAAAFLNDYLEFVAWLSDSDDDAYCRVHGFSGKISANCDQPILPVAAGPWVRTDGHPFAPTIDRLLSPSNEVYAPLWLDENGNEVTGSVFTGTLDTGAADTELCTDGGTSTDWASSSNGDWGRAGATYETSSKWTTSFSSRCDSGRRLICLRKGAGEALPPFAQTGKLAFVTSATGPGAMGSWPEADLGAVGIGAGHSICKNAARAAGLPVPVSFRAWLSASSTDAIDQFTDPGPWVRLDGVVVFPSRTDLAMSNLFTSLNLTETGSYLSWDRSWTGTYGDGLMAPDRCGDWLDGTSDSSGQLGLNAIANLGWTHNTVMTCENSFQHIYCLALDEGIFGDDFEGGDTTTWSTSFP